MKKINKHIEVVITHIDGLDLMSVKTLKMVCDVLQNYYTKVGVTIIKEEADLEELVQKNPNIVFSGVKSVEFKEHAINRDSPDKIWLAEYLDKKGIRYTGSPRSAIELEFDKSNAKREMQKFGINTAPFFIAQPGQYRSGDELPLRFPLFIKPLWEGDGRGIGSDSIVTDFDSYEKKVQDIFRQFKTSALVEKYLSGREFTVGIFDASSDDLTAMPIELIACQDDRGNRILGAVAKEADQEQAVAITNDEIHKSVSSLAKNAFKIVGARDFGRIDIRMDEEGVPYFLEANLVPGLGTGYFARACRINKKMTHEDMILKIVEMGLTRDS